MKRTELVWCAGGLVVLAAAAGLGYWVMTWGREGERPVVEVPVEKVATERMPAGAEAVVVVEPEGPLDVLAPRVAVQAAGESLEAIFGKMGVAPGRVKISASAARGRYSLNGEKLRFWDAFLALQGQVPSIAVAVPSEIEGVMEIDAQRPQRQVVVKGPMALFYRYWPEGRYTDGRKIPAYLEAVLGIDPRLTVVEVEAEAAEIKDEAGNVLYKPGAASPGADYFKHTTSTGVGMNVPLTLPAAGALKIPVLNVKARVVYVLEAEEAEIKDLTSGVVTIKVGKTTVTVTGFREEGQVFMGVNSTAAGMVPYVIYELYDRTGALVRRWTVAGAQQSGSVSGKGGPFRLKLVVPQKVMEVREEFEVRDVEARG